MHKHSFLNTTELFDPFASDDIQLGDTGETIVSTGLPTELVSTPEIPIVETVKRPMITSLQVDRVKMASINDSDVVKAQTVEKNMGEIEMSMFSSIPTIKPEFKVLGEAPNEDRDRTTLIEIESTYKVVGDPITYHNVAHGVLNNPDYDTGIELCTTHTYYMRNGIKQTIVDERVVKSSDLDDLSYEYNVGAIDTDILQKNPDVMADLTDLRVINGAITPITASGSFEYIKTNQNSFNNKSLMNLHLMPLYLSAIKGLLLASEDVLTINKLKEISPNVSILHVTPDIFNKFKSFVKEHKSDFVGTALSEVLSVGDDLDGDNDYHLMSVAINEAVKSVMLKTAVSSMTLTLLFREGGVKVNISHYINLEHVNQERVLGLRRIVTTQLNADLTPFFSEWAGRDVHGTFRVDGTNNNIYVVDTVNGTTHKEKVALPSSNELGSANYASSETVSNLAKLLTVDTTISYGG